MLDIIDAVNKVSPNLGAAISSPAGAIVLNMLKNKLGSVDTQEIIKKLSDPAYFEKIKELEVEILADVQDARDEANKEVGLIKFSRPVLALAAMGAAAADIYSINVVQDPMLKQVLLVMLIVIIWDIRQIYKFYFGSNDSIFSFLNLFKK